MKNIFNQNEMGVERIKVLNFEKLLLCKMKENWQISKQKTCKKTNLQDNFPEEVIRKPAHFCMMGKFWPNFCKQSVMGGEIPRGGLLSSF
jgi:hypothetical protein